mmetsp:Transcript_33476/g.50638  ORF Transcript_33476/g.50638 Transcript_33476/m.50638 type:complete len:154 (+) Transcript_33476:103-564(+)
MFGRLWPLALLTLAHVNADRGRASRSTHPQEHINPYKGREGAHTLQGDWIDPGALNYLDFYTKTPKAIEQYKGDSLRYLQKEAPLLGKTSTASIVASEDFVKAMGGLDSRMQDHTQLLTAQRELEQSLQSNILGAIGQYVGDPHRPSNFEVTK